MSSQHRFAAALCSCLSLAACGGGGSGATEPAPSIRILEPTADATYSTTSSDIRLGGSIARASFVHVTNARDGSRFEGYVNYFAGQGSWFADVYGLAPGENRITAVADADGAGTRTATARITVVRPDQPVDLIFNGANPESAGTFWIDEQSVEAGHKIALFRDGTGKSTTGNVLTQVAGPVASFTWSMLAPDSIGILGCPTCSFQSLSRVAGSTGEALFYGQVETVGQAGETALHAFTLTEGRL